MKNNRNILLFSFLVLFIFSLSFSFSQETNLQESDLQKSNLQNTTKSDVELKQNLENEEIITGVWENPSRFLYLSSDGKSQLVLKPYYGFLYEPFPSENGKIVSASSFFKTIDNEKDNTSDYSKILNLQYNSEHNQAIIPCMVTSDGLFFDFLKKLPQEANSWNLSADADEAEENQTEEKQTEQQKSSFSGFWLASGSRSSILLYNEQPSKEVYCWFFTNSHYCRIRYWLVDIPFSDKIAEITIVDEKDKTLTVTFPRLIQIENQVYSCVTLNDSNVRHYETGVYEILEDKIVFTPQNSSRYKPNSKRALFTGKTTIPFYFDETKTLLAFDKPAFVPYQLNGEAFDSVVSEHNKLRRPAREPLVPLMKLDFHWEEVERLRKSTAK